MAGTLTKILTLPMEHKASASTMYVLDCLGQSKQIAFGAAVSHLAEILRHISFSVANSPWCRFGCLFVSTVVA